MRRAIGKFGLLTAVATMLFVLGPAGDATAGLVGCPAGHTANGTAKVTTGTAANLTAASACQYIDPPGNNIADAATVNAAAFFGINTWSVNVAKLDLASNAGQSGTWALAAGANFSAFNYMITFKDGASKTNLTSFLLNGASSSGNWFSPFTSPPFNVNNTTSVSHFTIFQSAKPAQVPELSSLALLGMGLFGVGFARRRKQND